MIINGTTGENLTLSGVGWNLHYKNGWGFIVRGEENILLRSLFQRTACEVPDGRVYIAEKRNTAVQWVDNMIAEYTCRYSAMQLTSVGEITVKLYRRGLLIDGADLYWEGRNVQVVYFYFCEIFNQFP